MRALRAAARARTVQKQEEATSGYASHLLIISVQSMESDQLPTDRVAMLRMMPMPADANVHGDVFGGWIMSHVDVAGAIPPRAARAGASRRSPSRHSCSGRRFSSATWSVSMPIS